MIGETVVCITNINFEETLIVGNKYLITDTTSGREIFYYRVRNSLDELGYYNSEFFITLKEYREKQLNDLGI